MKKYIKYIIWTVIIIVLVIVAIYVGIYLKNLIVIQIAAQATENIADKFIKTIDKIF